MDTYINSINDKGTQELLKNYSTVHFLPPKPTDISKKHNRSWVELLKPLITNEDLQASVTCLLANPEKPHSISPDSTEEKPSVTEIKAEVVPNFLLVNNEIILIEDDSDTELQQIPKRDSGIGSSDHSEVHPDSLSDDENAIYADPLTNSTSVLEDNCIAEFWEPPEIRENETYLVPIQNNWVKAKMTEKLSKKKFRLTEIKRKKIVEVKLKMLALARPVDNFLNVGSRVIAAYKKFCKTGEFVGAKGRGKFKLGVVAEIPSNSNKHRYLIIFDNGYWLYVSPLQVRPIFYSSRHIWRQVPRENRKVVKYFLKGRFVPLNKIIPGQSVVINDASPGVHYCQVLAVDASLVLVWYLKHSQAEWIYIGSPRLQLLHSTN